MRVNNSNHWLYSPVTAYFLGFIVPFLLVYVGFSKHVTYPSLKTLQVVVLGGGGFCLGLLLVFLLFNFYVKRSFCSELNSGGDIKIHQEVLLFRFLLLLWVVGMTMLWFEFYSLGRLPLLSDNVEELRFKLQVNGYTHLLAISSGFVSFLLFALYLISDNSKLKKIYLVLVLSSISSLVMTANRMDFMYPLFLMVLFYIYHTGTVFSKKVAFCLAAGVVVFVALNIFRSSGYSEDYISDNFAGLGDGFESNWLNVTLYPFYMTLTYSFEMLNKLVNSGVEGVTGGMYTFYAFVSLEPGHQESFGEFKNRILNIDFYAELTSTYLSNFYVDFGKVGVFWGSFIYACIVQLIWCILKVSKVYGLLYVVIIAPVFFLFYAFYYVYFYAFFQVAIVIFVTCFLRTKNYKED